ncbi:acyltransferase [Ferruginibacter lapsinanis]|uniref:acyltransferase family protein n=1 Tax=Ferruginibacter lapsinanis TaxID=563172 RepID=UPI0021D3FF75|nr:acyltransferase [Ferruginibacter lapsinanis]UEG49014.1 acyltransferase [Ferruginibacter lapsinanis]
MYNNNFNFLRLLGAILVIFSHSFYVAGEVYNEPVNAITNGQFEASAFGLSIFFFISGLLVTKSALDSRNVIVFLRKRIYRIYPALVALVLISVFIIGPIFTQLSVFDYFANSDTWKYLYTMTGFRIRMNLPGVFTDNFYNTHSFNASLWSIEVELFLYLSLALFLFLGMLKRKKLFAYIAALVMIICILLLAFKPNTDGNLHRHLNLICIFYLGCFVAVVKLNQQQVLLILFSSAAAYMLFRLINLPNFDPSFLLLPLLSLPVYLFGFSNLIKLWIKKDLSYGLYIFAFPVQQMLFKISSFPISAYGLFYLTLLITTGLAMASWAYIEKPFILMKNKKR